MLVLVENQKMTALEKMNLISIGCFKVLEITPEIKRYYGSLADYQFKIPKNIVSYIIAHYNYSPYSRINLMLKKNTKVFNLNIS